LESLFFYLLIQLQHLKDILQNYNSMNQKCEHFKEVDEENTSPNTKGCEECEKEKSDWVALRMCLVCGHVGCCDSSIGLHARKHFENTGHPVMIALPNKPWRWCYEHKQYY
jgi:uncharacterized UBP type Zn finger protein